MSYLLEKLAARAIVRRWNDLSSKTKDRLRKIDPDTFDSYNRNRIGKDNEKKVHKVEYLGGNSPSMKVKEYTASKFTRILPYSSSVIAVPSADSSIESFDARVIYPDKSSRRASSLINVLNDEDAKYFRKKELLDSIVSKKGISALPERLRKEYIRDKKQGLEMIRTLPKEYRNIAIDRIRKQDAFVDSNAKAYDKGDNAASLGHEFSELIHGIRNIRSATKDGVDMPAFLKKLNQGIGTHSNSSVLIDEAGQYPRMHKPVRKTFVRQRSSGEGVIPHSPDEEPRLEAAIKYKDIPQIDLIRPGTTEYANGFSSKKPISNTQRRRILERASKIQKELFPNRETDFDVARRHMPRWRKER